MSRSKHARKPKDRSHRHDWCAGDWAFESNKEQRRRLKQEVDQVLKDPDMELQISEKRKSWFDWA